MPRYDDIIGYENQDIIGSDELQAPSGKSVSLRQRTADRARMTVLPFTGGTIAAGASASFTARTQVLFRPDRLVIPSTISGLVDITDLRIGKNSQFASTGTIPAALFSELAENVVTQFDTIQTNQDVTLTVTNNATVSIVFRGAFAGRSVE